METGREGGIVERQREKGREGEGRKETDKVMRGCNLDESLNRLQRRKRCLISLCKLRQGPSSGQPRGHGAHIAAVSAVTYSGLQSFWP